MRTLILFILSFFILQANATDIFYYSPKNGEGGLRFAMPVNGDKFIELGKNFNFVSSDFGPWGSGKKMFDPVLVNEGSYWILYFKANKEGTVYGKTETEDFIHWKPQKYLTPEELPENVKEILSRKSISLKIGNKKIDGRFIDINDTLAEQLKSHISKKESLSRLYSERTDSDFYRFKGLNPVSATLKINRQGKDISPMLMGIFFEDINYAADGGLYAELIQNRDFEYKRGENHDKEWGPGYGWEKKGKNLFFEVREDNPLTGNNPHYAHLKISGKMDEGSGLYNYGYDGISLKEGEHYKFRIKARSNKEMPLEISLYSPENKLIDSNEILINTDGDWREYQARFKSDENIKGGYLKITPKKIGEVDLDMISLFPENTFKGRENGLRSDLAQTLADLKPSFVRFPGGCVAHGNGIDNIYDWKGSIGSLEDRKPLFNLWGYHQTRGLGYHEYFLFCEDIGAEPLPVLAAGVPCQNSGQPSRFTVDDLTLYGQQQGIPMDSMQSYINDILDLIEYANGPVSSAWGAKRAQAGHPEPFELKYIGIGNEDMITEIFEERFKIISDAIKEKYPEITVIGTVGPFFEGSDYDEGWRFAKEENVEMVDEHYYVEPGWLIYNQNYYDDYDRNGPKVYLGEWAAHLPDRSSTMETALAEAIYLTALERNGDVVSMSSYAPLLAKKDHTQWRPDLIYFDNDSVYLTTDYHIMRLMGENTGDKYLYNVLDVNNPDYKVKSRIASSVVEDSKTGDVIIKLVNMLPVVSDINIDLEDLLKEKPVSDGSYKITVMKGAPDAKEAEIQEETKSIIGSSLNLNLEPYSFTIIRF